MLARDVAFLADAIQPSSLSSSELPPAIVSQLNTRSSSAVEIAFVDSGIRNDSLQPGLLRPGVELVAIDRFSDPFQQIDEVLQEYDSIDAIHIISHGSDGQILLGGRQIDTNAIEAESLRLQEWRDVLAPDADILLYGCRVTSGQEGEEFINAWSRLTGADVAGSSNLTGSAGDDSDWILEISTGSIEASLFASESVLREIDTPLLITFDDSGVLPNYPDFSSVADLNLNANAQQAGNALQLTADSANQRGSAFFDESIALTSDASFESGFTFQILGGAGADGFTFTIQNDPQGADAFGTIGGGSSLAYEGITNSIAVEFDTYNFQSLEFNNNHVAIISGTVDNEYDVADPGFDINDGNLYFAWVEYDGPTDSLSVYTSTSATKPSTPLIQATVDLETVVGSEAYFGFTAATGGAFNAHQIRSWTMTGSTLPVIPDVTVAVSPSSVLEDGTGTLDYTFTRSVTTSDALTVNYTVGGGATEGTDYPALSGSIVIPANQPSVVLQIDPTDDTTDESSETDTIVITLSDTADYDLGTPSSATGTITDDDAPIIPDVTVAVSPSSVLEDGTGTLDYTFTRSVTTSDALTVNYTVGGGATEGTDYPALSGSIVIPANQPSVVLPIDPTDDTTDESSETDTIVITLSDTADYDLGTPSSATGTITDDDAPIIPDVTVAVSPSSVLEDGTGTLDYTFTRSVTTSDALTVNYTVGGGATEGTDYPALSGSIVIPANQPSVVLPIDPTDDTTDESSETDTIVITLSDTADYDLGTPSSATGTITDDDAPIIPDVTVAVSPLSVLEDGTGTLDYTFTRSVTTSDALTVNYTVGGGATEGTDYPALSGSIVIPANQPSVVLPIDPTDDTTDESSETDTIVITLSDTADYDLGTPSSATGTITDDDAPLPSLPNYPDFSSVADLTFNTDAQQTGNALQLTADSANQRGSSFFDQAISLATDASFTSVFSFQVLGVGGADGFTFTIQNDPRGANAIGTVFGGSPLAYEGITNSIAVEFDTYKFAPTEFNNNHVAIISGTVDNEYDVADPGFDINDGNLYFAWVEYDGPTDSLSVYTSTSATKPSTPLIQATVDLETVVGSEAYFGFTAATGGAFNAHQIRSWTMTGSTLPVVPDVMVTVSPSSVLEDGTGTLDYTFTRSVTTSDALTVNYTVGGGATEGTDYPALSGSIVIPANQPSVVVQIDPTDDTTDESSETDTIVITLSDTADYDLGTPSSATGTITDDDAPIIPDVTVAVSPSSVLEDGTGTLDYTFTRSVTTSDALTVNYTVGGGATEGTDYPALSGSIVIPANQPSVVLPIDPTDDTTDESSETDTIVITLSDTADYDLGTPSSATGTITDDDAPIIPDVTVAVSPSSVLEDGTGTLDYTFTRSVTTSDALTVNYTVGGGATEGTDYPALSGSIVIPANQPSVVVQIDPTDDTTDESSETDTIVITLSDTADYDLGTPSSATGTITDDDAPIIPDVTVAVSPLSVLEDGTGTLDYTFTRSVTTSDALTVNYTVGGGATQGTDYPALSGSIVIPANQPSVVLPIDPTDDTTDESSETDTIVITLSDTADYDLGTPSSATGTITDDDAPIIPDVTVAVSPLSVLEDGTGTLDYTFTRSVTTSDALTVNYTVGGGATEGTDYPALSGSIVIPANQPSVVLPIDPTDDTTDESSETDTIVITLSDTADYDLGTPSSATGTITDDDAPIIPDVTVAVSPSSVLEDGTGTLDYTFTRSVTTSDALTVNYTVGGGATEGTDYPALSGSIVIPANQPSVVLPIDPTDDTTDESSETDTIVITLSDTADYDLGTPSSATGTITDDDAPIIPDVTVAVSPLSVLEDGTGTLDYTFTRSVTTSDALTVNYTVGGGATEGTDYPALSGSIVIPANQPSVVLPIDPTDDTTDESSETDTIVITLSDTADYDLGTPSSATGTITDDDAPLPSLPNYPDFSSVADLTFNTDAQQTGNALQLTADSANQRGSSFFDQAISLATDASFTSVFSFQVLGVGGADGFTFTIQNDPRGANAIGTVFGGSPLAYEGITNSIAVEFDTYKFAPTEFNNNHVAIISGTVDNEYDVADPGFDINDGNLYFAWVEYDGPTDSLSVYTSTSATKPSTPLIQATVDLETVVGSEAYFGFTAATGGAFNAHQIRSWTMTGSTLPVVPDVMVTVSPSSVLEDGTGTLDYTFTRSVTTSDALTVNYTVGGGATEGTDYPALSGSIVIPANQPSVVVQIDPTDDTTDESSETDTIVITLSDTADYDLGTPSSATGTIVDDEAPVIPDVTVAVSPSSVLEDGTGTLDYTFTRSVTTSDALTVNYTVGGGATEGTDYPALSGSIVIPANQPSVVLPIDPTDDTTDESSETDTIVITLSDTADYDLGTPSSATGTITDDDAPIIPDVTVAVSPSSVLEDGTGTLDYTFTRSVTTSDALTVNYTVGGGATEGTDYPALSGSIVIPANQPSVVLPIDPTDDTTDESSETDTIVITLSDTADYDLGTPSSATGTITDDDVAQPGVFALETSNVTVDEEAGQVSIDVLRSNGSDGIITIDFDTQPDTATPGADYTPQSDTLVFGDGETVKSIVIPILSDILAESNERFNITIDNPSGNSTLLVPRTATITIVDDDTLLPNYPDFSSTANINFNGDASQVGDLLELTPNSNNQIGSAFFDQSIPLSADASFRSAFSFQILGGNGADGFTFTIQDDPAGADAIGAFGSALGYEGITNSIAVEFDTYKNSGTEFNNNHIAVVSGTVANELGLAVPDFDLNSGDEYYTWVDYNGVSDVLAIYVSTDSTKPEFALFKTTVDLESEVGISAYFGFTAATGGFINAHQITSWTLDQQVPPLDPPTVPGDTLLGVSVASGLNQPIAIEWLPNGTMLIAEKSGVVKTVTNGVVSPTPFIDISDIVNGVRDRGLLGMAVHPQFASHPYVYLLFTYDPPEVFNQAAGTLAGPDGKGNRAGRLIKVEADVTNNYLTAVPGPFEILLGQNSTWANFNGFANSTSDLNEPPAGELPGGLFLQDFINSDSESHTVGDIAFGKDGNLFVTIGDGASYNAVDVRADRVQNIDSLSGKVLRIDPLTGLGLSSNPFFNGDVTANRSKVYQLGLRNPFRIAVDDLTGQLFIGDVGWTTWEEINSAGPEANFGWPFYEGASGTNAVNSRYANTPEGVDFFNQNVTVEPSILALSHQADGINAIVMGDVYRGSAYGAEYVGDVFFNDLGQGIVRHASIDANGAVTDIGVFANGASVVVAISEGPDGFLYYTDLDDGIVGRWIVV